LSNKRLIVNADDFGFTRDVNEGIVEAHRNGILTSTTIMATGGAFDHAVALARQTPSLDIGVHLVLVGEPRFPETPAQLALAVARRRIRIYEELDAQIRRVFDTGLHPTHLDSHKHTHILPPVLGAIARLSAEHAIPWVRRPMNLPLLTGRLRRNGCRVTDRFEGFRYTGHLGTTELVAFLDTVREGVTEFMCHPGYCTDELRAAPTRLKESRQRELEALTSPEVRKAVARAGIVLSTFRELSASD
jgi:predicted glycoside hydrolase/deacetylase ChbG (UPF0249 family)